MKIKNDSEILNQDLRVQFIQEINSPANITRKKFMKRRYDVFKDDTKKYVLEYFEDESSAGEDILPEIKNRASNISFCRKIIDKKCMVYKDGAKREVAGDDSEELQTAIDLLTNLLNINSVMKKANKYEELFKNSLVQVVPYETNQAWKLKLSVIAPYLYDVIEDSNNPELAKVVVLSSYKVNSYGEASTSSNADGVRGDYSNQSGYADLNDTIQSLSQDPNEQVEYIWWSDNYHFTTNAKGELIPGKQEDNLANPIGELPFVDFSRDKDGNFWAVGGEDIVEGSILLNVLLTDLYFIAKFQGMGIGYMFGKGVPKNMKVGPSSFVTLEVEQGDPTPSLGFASSNPPIDSHIRMIEGYLAYLLSTNNLEAGSIVGTLTAQSATSGVQEAIKRSENLDDVEDQQEVYRDNEPQIFKLVFKWMNLYFDRGLLADDFLMVGKIPDNTRVVTKFNKPQTYLSAKDRLDVIEKRLTLGLDSKIDAIMQDNPNLTKEEAEEKLERINQEVADNQRSKMQMYMPANKKPEMTQDDMDEEEDGEEDGEDNVQDKAATD